MAILAPQGFVGVSACIGLKDRSDDFALIASATADTTSAAMHTQSRFAGASVQLNRASNLSGFRGIVALSKNANVATDAQGLANATEVRARAAALAGCAPEEILIASTGVIGVQYPMPAVRQHLEGIKTPLASADFAACAQAIMTTDTHPKLQTRRCGDAVVLGIAKGVGMIEPNMATMLAFFFTDAQIPAADLDTVDIGIDLGIDHGSFTVYGCDLTEGYVHLNADYTT